MGPALAKKAYAASDYEVALLTSGQSIGLLLNFVSSHMAARRRRVTLVFWMQLLSCLALCPVFFVSPRFAIGFVVLHALSRIAFAMAMSARILVWNSVFPAASRGALVGRLRQLQLSVTTVLAIVLSALLDWNRGAEWLVEHLGPSPVPAGEMVRYLIPVLACLGVVGCAFYRRIDERPRELGPQRITARGTLDRFLRVWRQDHRFRRYEQLFFVLGSCNIMVIPLIPIHAVERFDANYSELALVCVAIVQGTMALTMVFWGRRIDRGTPSGLRGWLNLILATELLLLAIGPSIEWMYCGALFRGAALGGGTLLWMLGPLWYARDGDEDIYTGIHACLTGLRWVIAPFLGVLLKDLCHDDARPAFLVAMTLLIVTGLALLRDGRREIEELGAT